MYLTLYIIRKTVQSIPASLAFFLDSESPRSLFPECSMATPVSLRIVVSVLLPAVPDELGVPVTLGSGVVSESLEPPLMLNLIILPAGESGS